MTQTLSPTQFRKLPASAGEVPAHAVALAKACCTGMGDRHNMSLTPAFHAILRADPGLQAMLDAMETFEAPDLWLVSGALFQAVWNVLDGQPRGHGINDYDLFYFDPDTSEEAEDAWIRSAEAHFAFASHPVQLRNQARVHLWYPGKFGLPYPQLMSSCDGVDQFLVQASVIAVRQPRRQVLDIYAPLGLDDIFTRTLRPNPLWKGPPRKEYQTKCARYLQHWPSLRMV